MNNSPMCAQNRTVGHNEEAQSLRANQNAEDDPSGDSNCSNCICGISRRCLSLGATMGPQARAGACEAAEQ
jgi:hypothetical protein